MKSTRFFQILIVVILMFVAAGSPVQGVIAAAKAPPQLVQLAETQPDSPVRVIVQQSAGASSAEDHVAALGGEVTRDLHMIDAFAAEMTAQAAVKLSRMESVRWVSLDAPMKESGGPDGTVNTSKLLNAYDKAVGADKLWAQGYQGSSVTVAVVDSGVRTTLSDIPSTRIVGKEKFNSNTNSLADQYGHGTHVAGVIGGNGALSSGAYIGIAPKVNLVSVKISDDIGMAYESDVVSGLQWVLNNKALYNIRVVNISLNSSVAQSYNTSPLDAAVEILWFNGIVVVVSAGNNGTATLYPPANDPFVITVGAVDDKGTASISDDVMASFSAYGTTTDGFAKPDLVAPGKNIVSLLSSNGVTLVQEHPANQIGTDYFRMSGTSFSTPIVSGGVALLLQDEPNLTPDQVKYRLMATANKSTKSWAGYSAVKAGAGYLDIYAAVYGTTTQSANTGLKASSLLSSGSEPITWGSVGWNSVGWNSVGWNSVGWNSVGWNSVSWNSDYWGP